MPGRQALEVARRHPVGVLAVVLAAVLAATAAPTRVAEDPSFLAMIAGTYWVGRHARARAAIAGLAAALATGAAAQILASPGSSHVSAIAFFSVVLVIAPATAGVIARARARLAERLRQAAARVRAARESRMSAAISGERQRIAAELDRVMLHALDGMRRHAAATDRAEVAELERLARGTLAEMRGLLVRFRAEHAEDRASGGHEEGLVTVPPLPELRARVLAALDDQQARLPQAPALPASAVVRMTLPARRHVDAVLAVLALALAVMIAASRAWPAAALTGMAIMIPVAFLRRAPLPAAAVSLAATIGYSAAARPEDPLAGLTPGAMMVLVPLVTGAVCPTVRAVAVLIACLAVIAFAVVADPVASFSPVSVAGSVVLAVASWAVGRVIRGGSQLLAALTDAAAQEQEEEAAGARRAVAEERLQIARDLHDAVGHALTAIVMQATAARRVWDTDPVRAAEHVAALRETASQAVQELHVLVISVAVGGDALPAGISGVEDLAVLAEQARRTGLPVRFAIAGTGVPVSPAVSRAAYRIAQEAITNAARHAPGARVEMTACFTAAGLIVEVTNRPPAWPALQADGAGGHGLPGMRERAGHAAGPLRRGHGRTADSPCWHACRTGSRSRLPQSLPPRRPGEHPGPGRRRPVARANRVAHYLAG